MARGIYKNFYAMDLDDEGFSLPVWSNRERVVDYLNNAHPVGQYEPYPVKLYEFTSRWLADQSMAIVELQLNPDGRSDRVLVVTTEEFQATQAGEQEP